MIDLDALLDRIGGRRLVLLGEASHGTHEYYAWRARISKRLIETKGFRTIAVEGDWPDCMAVNHAIREPLSSPGERGRGEGRSMSEVLSVFERWPTWMWANWEIAALGEWLRGRDVGFYGLDVYSLYESMDAALRHLEAHHPPEVAAAARAAYACFDPYRGDPADYARATVWTRADCEDEVVGVLTDLLRSRAPGDDPEAHFDAEMNARVAADAERYYRAMVRGSSESWNVRDVHMMDTLDRLIEREGKAVVWAHNTHVGDARWTDMAARGMTNLGQLARERHGEENVFILGFGSYEGAVIAGDEWGAPMARMVVPPAPEESWEGVLHARAAEDRLILDFEEEDLDPRGHRAIGVVYDPAYESYGNYVPTIVPYRYDAFLYLDRTTALHPLHPSWPGSALRPDTYPFGV